MAAGGFDGSININTKVDSSGFNKGIKSMDSGMNGIMSSLKGLAVAVGLAFGVAAVVNFGKASVTASTNLSNAMLGLRSIVEGQGRSFSDTQAFMQKYISDGLIPATDAVTAYKNLAMRGYTDPQIQSTLDALKDSAAFGRQASLTLGQAVSSATEGLKNENSILVDNAGVTKNVSMMWKDYAASIGVGVDSLTKQQKIQAEVTGIMQETRFQTGDAEKLTATYSGEILKLGFNFNNLKIAIGNAIIPMAQAVLPGLNLIITALTRVANLFAQVTTALFGKQANQQQKVADTANNIASSSTGAAKAQNKLADATKKAGKAADNNMASWDDLNVLQEDTASTTTDTSTPDVTTGAGTGVTAGQDIGAGVTVSPAVQAAADTIRGIFDNLSKAFEPTKVALQGLWTEFQRLGGFAWQGLLDFYNTFLVPVGKWTLGVGLPGFINAMKDGMSKIDWGKINTALHGLWVALTPFAINVGEGLLWFWTNVLVPLGTWTMNNVVPLFIDMLAASIGILNGIITALEPLGLWLFDNFLKPIADWTGGIIVSVLDTIKEALKGIADWISANKGPVQDIATVIGAFAAAWLLVNGAIAIWNVIGAIAAGVTTVFGAAVAFLTSPIGLVVIVIGLLIAIIIFLVRHWDDVKAAAAGCWDGIVNAWNSAGDWFNSTVIQPLKEFFSGLWEGIKNAASAAWGGIVSVWNVVAGWFNSNIIQPISQFFTSMWSAITTAATTAWSGIVAVWTVVANWFNTYIIVPVKGFFTAMWDAIKTAARMAWDGIVAVWTAVSGWFNTNIIQPVGKFFADLWAGVSSAAGNAWTAISGVWAIVSGWFHDKVIAPIETAFKTSINFMIGLVEGFVNFFIDGVNGIINALNTISIDVPKGVPKIGGMKFGVDIPTVGHLAIPRLASGAVIPPNAEFAAILGDNRNGRNLEAPEGLIREIVADELGKIDFQPQVNVIASGDNAGLVRWMKFEIDHETTRVGTKLVTGGGR